PTRRSSDLSSPSAAASCRLSACTHRSARPWTPICASAAHATKIRSTAANRPVTVLIVLLPLLRLGQHREWRMPRPSVIAEPPIIFEAIRSPGTSGGYRWTGERREAERREPAARGVGRESARRGGGPPVRDGFA